MVATATVFLLAFAVLAALDGVGVHLVWLRLHARERSWAEHVWHTASAVLFVPILVTVFLAPTAGATLWVGVALLALLHVVELLDVRSERSSRSDLGGVSRAELTVHVLAVGTRTIAVILAFASRPLASWLPAASTAAEPYPGWVGSAVSALVPGAIVIAAIHVWLAWRHRPASAPLVLAS